MRCNLCVSLGSNGCVSSKNGFNPNKRDLMDHCRLHAKHIDFSQNGEYPSIPTQCPDELFRACFDDLSKKADGVKTERETVKVEGQQEKKTNGDRELVKLGTQEAIDRRKSKKNPFPIAAFCRKLLAKRRWTPRVVCFLCAKSLRFFNSKTETKMDYHHIVQHAMSHLSLPLYSCRICPFTSTTRRVMGIHLREDHALSDRLPNYENRTSRYTKSIRRMIQQCFGNESNKNDVDRDKSIFSEYFRQLHTVVWKGAGNVRCNQCRRDLVVTTADGRARTRKYVDHALMHLRKFLFACKLCTHRSCSRKAMYSHLHTVHRLGPHIRNYSDATMENREKILEMLESCFGRVTDEAMNGTNREAPISRQENMVKSRAGDNHQLADRLVYSQHLYKKFAKSNAIDCLVCLHRIKCSKGAFQSQKLIWHASTHTTQPLYECKRCSKSIHVMSSVYRHMKKEHAITKEINKEIIDHSDQLHDAIMDALKRSFDHSVR